MTHCAGGKSVGVIILGDTAISHGWFHRDAAAAGPTALLFRWGHGGGTRLSGIREGGGRRAEGDPHHNF